MKKLLSLAGRYLDAGRMLETAGQLSRHHRIQASPGFRAAAHDCAARLEALGIPARILSFPADGRPHALGARPLMEWAMRDGRCEIDGLGPIADYRQEPLSVICRSMGCDFRAGALEVVYLDKSADPADYPGLDLAGKLAFVRGNINHFAWAALAGGALGLITDFVLQPDHHQDVLRYTSFWWRHTPGEKRYFGFCLSPSRGRALAEHCLRARAEGRPVLARGFIDADYAPGALEVVDALLPGETQEEILITAHLCHPQSSSNDNTSGVAAAIEGLYALKQALDAGDLPPLRRGIRLLLVPEMLGTATWLEHLPMGAPRPMAALNLDMVGGRQDATCGPLVLTCLPRSTPSFTEYAAMLALEGACSQYTGFNPAQTLPSVNHALSAFSGGSDHYILSDPTVGIPCTMLGQWPDRFYHTSGDTMDRLCPRTLWASAATLWAFCAALGGLTPAGLPALLSRGKVRFAQELSALGGAPRADEALEHLLAAYRAAFQDAERFFPGDAGVGQEIGNGQAALEAIAFAFREGSPPPARPAPGQRPRRRWAMPLESARLAALGAEDPAYRAYDEGPRRQLADFMMTEPLACYYMDGRRDVDEIIRLAELDTGLPLPQLRDYIGVLVRLGLAEMV